MITFDTAWSNPYPVLAAFCNRFQVPFEHRYFDEGSNFWGIDTWDASKYHKRVQRTTKRWKKAEDEKPLALELKNRDLDAEAAEEALSGE